MNKKVSFPIAAIFLILSVVLSVIRLAGLPITAALNFTTILSLCVDVFVAVALIKKDRGIMLLVALTCTAVVQLITLIGSFGLSAILDLLAWLFVLVLALDACEQNVIKVDISKIAAICQKLFFVPALLSIGVFIATMVQIHSVMGYVPFMSILSGIVGILAIFFLTSWLVNPYEKEKTVPVGTYGENSGDVQVDDEAYCGLGKHIVLCLFTCGIWYLIWTYRTTKFLNKAPGVEQYNPTTKLLLCIFVPFYQIYWFYKHGQRIDALCRYKNLNSSDMGTMCLLLGIFIPIVACIIMQDRINLICTTRM